MEERPTATRANLLVQPHRSLPPMAHVAVTGDALPLMLLLAVVAPGCYIAVAAVVVAAARRIVAVKKPPTPDRALDLSGTATAVGRTMVPRQDPCDANVCGYDRVVVPMTMAEKQIEHGRAIAARCIFVLVYFAR
jgi:anti-sigma factor ChrR (cupin superfamily)